MDNPEQSKDLTSTNYVPGPDSPLVGEPLMNWRTPALIGGVGIVVLLLVVGAYFLGARRQVAQQVPSDSTPAQSAIPTNIQSVSSETPIAPKPQGIRFQPNNNAAPAVITNSPLVPTTNLFKHPDQPAYEPGKGFAPDAQRILDITSLQISLEKYRVANGHYPPSLNDLFPTFAPVENGQTLATPPSDPETHQVYSYKASADGADYQLTATLSNSEPYTVTKRISQ